jgi:hypothetical protein
MLRISRFKIKIVRNYTMPEHLPHQQQEPSISRTANTYDELIEQNPDMHPGVRAHVARLASEEVRPPSSMQSEQPSYFASAEVVAEPEPQTITTLTQRLAETIQEIPNYTTEDLEKGHMLWGTSEILNLTNYTTAELAAYVDHLAEVNQALQNRNAEIYGSQDTYRRQSLYFRG